ncbi:hypothetical protein DMA11_19925 [Marinilabiliaceae bacterium JC017]|nr:hypothetical protein DMA11_19925 [Marinilabiliaceae bacterium JC017]
MGFLEAIVVVYLRAIAYPLGFTFPLSPVPDKIIHTEIIREICTLIMLIGIAWLAGHHLWTRLAYFIFAFAIWDITYYLALKLFLNWPPTLHTWDVLFLIPIVWAGPVLAPLICSVTMLLLAFIILKGTLLSDSFSIKKTELTWLLTGSLIIITSFIWEYLILIINNQSGADIRNIIYNHIPENFVWPLFGVGFGLVLFAMALISNRLFIRKS